MKFLKKIIKKIFFHPLPIRQRIRRKIRNKNKILNDYFKEDIYILGGPFKGMLYSDTAYGSSILPKIFGTYEQLLNPWVEQAINKDYKTIIDIGCAEGYYSSGFAMISRNSKIYAYDTNKEILLKNKIENVALKEECTIEELENMIDDNTLIFCDIEGEEINLIDPNKSKKLLEADYIIETHDFKLEDTTERLIERFKKTHNIEVVSGDEREIPEDVAIKNKKDIDYILDEGRPANMKWIKMMKK